MKDWKKSRYKIESIEPLPEYKGAFVTVEELHAMLKEADLKNCSDENGLPFLTIIDYRTENFYKPEASIASIKTKCPILRCLIDDFTDPKIRQLIPKNSPVILVCETGSRNAMAMRYLFKFGYTNTMGLQFGMRGWLKMDFPVEIGHGKEQL